MTANPVIEAPSPVFAGDTMRLTFDRFDMASYDLFLRTKSLPEHAVLYDEIADAYTVEAPSRFAAMLGFQLRREARALLPLIDGLFDYQEFFVRHALTAKRFAFWWDTGIGKTYAFLEWARQVQHLSGGKVLIVELLNLIPQVLDMARTLYGDDLQITVLESRAAMREWCKSGPAGLAIVNPEKFIPPEGEEEVVPEITYCAGVVLDESSLLKTGGGVIKWALIKSCRGVEYKLSCTATPAPNDPIEYASQAAWLEKIRDEGEVIWTYFVRDSDGEWRIKEHALGAFYTFLSGWSCYLRKPGNYGFRDNVKELPAFEWLEHHLPSTPEQREAAGATAVDNGRLSFAAAKMGIVERGRLGTISSGFLYRPDGTAKRIRSLKPETVASIAQADLAAGLQVIIWTLYDETAVIIGEVLRARGIASFELVTGKTAKAARPAIVERFRRGETPLIITRGKVLGFGQNLQCCGSMIFPDINDSYEGLYQMIRRGYRYGQTLHMRLHFPLVDGLQSEVWSNVQSKARRFEVDVETMERLYIDAMQDELPGRAA